MVYACEVVQVRCLCSESGVVGVSVVGLEEDDRVGGWL